MNHLLLALSVLAVLSAKSQDIPKGSTTILVSAITYKQAVDTMLDLQYAIETSDKDFQLASFISPKYPSLRINIRIKDTVCIFKETYAGMKIYYASKGDAPAFRRYFEIMDKIARSFNGRVSYSDE